MMLYTRCQRTTSDGDCDGNLYAEVIEGVTELVCLRCGWRYELGRTSTRLPSRGQAKERPITGGGNEVKRWRRGQ